MTLAVANHSTDGNGNKDGANDDKNDLPDLHAVENRWKVGSACWDDHIRR